MTSQGSLQIKARVGRNIRLARQTKQLTQRELGKALDVDSQVIWRWEAGRVMPRPDTLVALGVALGRDPGWFYADRPDEVAA